MSTDLMQLIRLEIERPPDAGELVNLIQNPSGELGAWFWVTPVAGSTLRSVRIGGAYLLVYTSPGGAASHFYSEPMTVAPGQYVAARWVAPALHGLYSAVVEWLDAGGNVTGSSAATSNLGASADARAHGSFLVPSGVTRCRLRFDHYDGTGGVPSAETQLHVRDVVVTAADTAGELGWTRTNLLTRPSAEGGSGGIGSQGGAEVGTSTAQSWDGTHSFTLTKTGSKGPAEMIWPSFAVQPGRDYALQARSRPETAERKVTVSARWIAADGKVIATAPVKSQNEPNGGWTVPLSGVATAPSNAARLRLVVQYANMAVGEVHYIDAAMVEQASTVNTYFDGDTGDALGVTHAWNGTPWNSTSTQTGPTGDVGELVPVKYQNILGPSQEIAIDREGLNVGSMNVRLFDAILDPTQSDLIKQGKRIRLVTTDGGVIFAGKVFAGNVTYHLLERDEQKRAEVTLTAVDPINPLAAAKRREGVATIAELPYVLEGAGVPWSCNGSGDQVPSATVVSYNDNASALDQVAVTRDSALGYAWVDRNGVLQAWDRDAIDATVAAVLDESTYNADFNVDFDLDRIINSVTVKVLRVIATSGVTEEVSFGPYVDADSYKQYGEHHAEFTVQGFDVADTAAIQAYAQQILDANATPAMRVNSMVLPIREAADLPKALLDLYDLVTVTNTRASINDASRITTIHHSITPSKWLMTLGYTVDGSVAPSTVVPSPPPGVGPIKDEITGGYSGSLQDIYDKADEAAAAAAEAAQTGTAALTAANGKNTNTYSTRAPVNGSDPCQPGDNWFVRNGTIVSAQYEGLGNAQWRSVALTNIVVTYLDAGVIGAGTAFTNALSVKTNFTLGDAATNGVIQSYNFANSSVGVFIDKNGLVAKGGSIAGATLTGVTVTGSTFTTSGSFPITLASGVLDFSGGRSIYGNVLGLWMVNGSNALCVDVDEIVAQVGAGSFRVTGGNGVEAARFKHTGTPPAASGAANTYIDTEGLISKSTASAARYKTNIRDHGLDADELWAWDPVRFDYREDSLWPGVDDRLGYIADYAVGTPFENFVTFDNGEVENYDYARHAAVVHTILLKELRQENADLRAELAELRAIVLGEGT